MVGVAAGLAISGYVPFVCAASPFLTGRGARADQGRRRLQPFAGRAVRDEPRHGLRRTRADPPLHRGPVLDAGDRGAGVSWCPPTPSRHVRPCDGPRPPLRRCSCGSVGSRCPRSPRQGAAFTYGRAMRLTDGDDVTVIAVGTMVSRALDAAAAAARQGVAVRVLNMSTVAPLDVEAVRRGRPGDPRHRHRRGGDDQRRAGCRGGRRSSSSNRPRPDAPPRRARPVRPDRCDGVPARLFRADHRRHRRGGPRAGPRS